jgi:hypothetical protein
MLAVTMACTSGVTSMPWAYPAHAEWCPPRWCGAVNSCSVDRLPLVDVQHGQKNRPYNCGPPLLLGWVTYDLHPGSWYGACYVQRIP